MLKDILLYIITMYDNRFSEYQINAPILNIYISWASHQDANSFNETSISGISGTI